MGCRLKLGWYSGDSFAMWAKRANDVAGSGRWQCDSCLQAVVETRRQEFPAPGEESLFVSGVRDFSDDEEHEEGSASSSWLAVCHSIRDQVHAGGAQRDGTSGCRDRHRLHGDRWMKKRCVRRLSILRATWMKVSTVGVAMNVGPRFGGLQSRFFVLIDREGRGRH